MAKRAVKEPRWLKAARLRDERPRTEKPDWVSRALSRSGVLPLKAAESAVREGRVAIDGRVVREPFSFLSAESKVTVDGVRVEVTPSTRVLVFHKPRGLVVAGDDDVGTVFEALAQRLPRELQRFGWLGVGRLDRDTTGVLLFTNDERFVEHATSPKTHLKKRYLVTVGGDVTPARLAQLCAGVEWEGQVSRPAQAELRSPGVVALTITEGRHHQVKRMMNCVGLATLALHREAVGEYVLDVVEGAVRALTDDEVERLLSYRPRHLPNPSP